ncbi:MAG: diguanylate cyclase [Nitrosomonadales bacterium]|nr:diguanylate cyclase [Nitrosomonadales bacterium]
MGEIFQQAVSILAVEDDPGDFGLIQAYVHLAELGIGGNKEPAIWAKTLADGIAAARSNKPDVVLLDLSLPDSAGLDTVRAMRAALPGVPIVVLTGHDDSALAVAALQAGAQDYLVKGKFEHDALGRAVRNALVREALESRLRLFEVAMNSVANGIVITDIHAHIQWVNPAFTRLTGFSLEEALGRKPGELVKSGKQDAAFYRSMWETILSGQTWHGEIVNRRKDGSIYDEALIIAPEVDGDGTIRHFVAIMQDITERKQAEEQISNLAFYDTLTQLPNRRLLNDRLEQTMAASKRSGHYGALMFLDLDNFKPLNDTYGHGVGDLLLVTVAYRLVDCVRETDTVARFGGDEFVVMLGELDADKGESATQAGLVAEKIRAALAEPYSLKFKHEGGDESTVEHHCAASIGVVLFINHDASPEDIIKWADMAMYQAKEGGRNSVRFYDAKD